MLNQLLDFWVEENFGANAADADGDGIPDSMDTVDNRTGMSTAAAMNMGMNTTMANVPMNVQPYLRRGRNALDANGALKEVCGIDIVVKVKHQFIPQVKFSVASFSTNQNAVTQGYNYAAQVISICQQIQSGGMGQMGMRQPGMGMQQPGMGMQQSGMYGQQQMPKAVCPSCGCQNTSNSKFCLSCGASLL